MVRSANKKDISSINSLGLFLNDDFNELYDFNEILDSKYDKVFVCEKDEMIIGFLHIVELDETVDIVNIVVDKNHRREGIATLLIDYMFDSISENIKLFTLEVNVQNDCAINLYKKFGFNIINIREKYYKDNDAYLMGKEV